MRILIAGAAGYIGAHVIRELRNRDEKHIITALDKNLHTSPNNVIPHVDFAFDMNILDDGALDILNAQYDAVIHLAAHISVEESTRHPTIYWRNNLLSTSRIIDHLHGAHLIFASTGTAFCPENAYAFSKVACEEEIVSRVNAFTNFRFYNVSGMAPGISATGHPTHLIRRAAMAARGIIPEITVYGTDWLTHDGTCVRDYIHVSDIASSICNALNVGPTDQPFDCLGSGSGYSVLDVIESMKRVSGVDFQVTMADRRPGDVASMICPTQYPFLSLKHDLDSMCHSAYEGTQDAPIVQILN